MITTLEVAKLTQSKLGITAAYKAGLCLQEKGWMRYPAASWDKPAILAFADEQCVGGVNYEIDEDERAVTILFAFCGERVPKALPKLLLVFRNKIRQTECEEIRFTCHPENEQMTKAVRVLGIAPHSLSYRMPADRLKSRAKARAIPLWKRLLQRLVK